MNTVLQIVIWVAAAGLLLMYLNRRRKRRTHDPE
jgi:membrane protein implicated in regulation of membrane protease activity